MSNRSYLIKALDPVELYGEFAFNSPWECRIGLTETSAEATQQLGSALSIPRGNVE